MLLFTFVPFAKAVRHMQANWRQELLITRLAGYGRNEFLVTSLIHRAFPPEGVYYNIEKKVTEPAKLHTETTASKRDGHTVKESFSIILHETSNSEEFRAEFTHEVFEDGRLKLRFTGVTTLPRW